MNVNVELFINSKFKKISQLKQSKRGEVWLAADENATIVVLKKIFRSGLPYKLIKDNPHSTFPKIIYCAEDANATLIIEEYIQGESLADRLQNKKYLTQDEAKNIILQLCDGLNFLHSHNIIHRDIKPEHLILQGSLVKLIDFDSVHIYKEGHAKDTENLDTEGYAPPEQYGFSQSDARNDIYALGATMKKLLDDSYNGYLFDILQKCTENNPAHRYQSVIELRDAIINYRPKRKWPKRILSIAASLVIIFAAYFIYDFVREFQIANTSINEVETPEKISKKQTIKQQKNNVKADVQKQDNSFDFPDITMPVTQLTNPPTPQSNLSNMPKTSTRPASAPLPQLPSITQSPIEQTPQPPANISNDVAGNYVKVEYYANGKRLNAWVDNWNYDVTNAGTSQYIKSNIWKNWQVGNDGLNIPSSYVQLQARVINYSQSAFQNPQLTITYNGGERKVLSGRTLQPGEEIIFDVPFNQTQIHDSELGQYDVKYMIRLDFSGNGAEIHGTKTEYELIFLKIGE